MLGHRAQEIEKRYQMFLKDRYTKRRQEGDDAKAAAGGGSDHHPGEVDAMVWFKTLSAAALDAATRIGKQNLIAWIRRVSKSRA